ncbi:MAG: hypothetical protein OEV66_01670 [Spirochaetia bacterium]|nr:hypothetical protein [Spirochaetia bacterium]
MYKKNSSILKKLILLFFLSGGVALFAVETVYSGENNTSPEEEKFVSVAGWRLWNIEFTRNDMNVLPNGNHNFFPLEYWAPNAILSNPDVGGFSLMEPVTLSIEGESVKWLRFHLNSLDISDPLDPGRPFIYMPIDLWSTYRILSPLYSYTSNSGLNWDIENNKTGGGMANVGAAGYMGGGSWVPDFFQDDPAQNRGAPSKVRAMAPSPEGSVGASFKGINNLPGQIFYEGIAQRRTFVLLNGYETANRNTVYMGQNLSESLDISGIYQHLDRDHYGIETGNTDTNTLTGGTDSFLLTLSPIMPEKQKFSWGLNAGYGFKKYTQNNPDPMVYSMINEIVYGKMPLPMQSHTGFFTNNLNFNEIAKLWIFDVSAYSRFRFEAVQEQLLLKNNMTAQTCNNSPADITIYNSSGPYTQYLVRLNPEVKLERQWESWNLTLSGGGLMESGFASKQYLLTRLDPTAAIKLSSKRGSPWEIYTGLQHDAIPLSEQELAFLNPGSPSGARYSWNDNGDGIPQSGENGTLYNVTGGKYHTLSKSMKYPARDELYLGIANNFSKNWSAALTLHGKYYTNLYFVGFDPSVDSGYNLISSPEVTDGRLYNRSPSAFGHELYMLTNSANPGYYASIEIQILKKNDRKDPWFFQISTEACYAQAYTIPGNGPEYNDMGQYAESSANPNKQKNTLAITDGERAYLVNILFGFNLGPFSIANTMRYRDGQPWGSMLVPAGLSDGPVIVQDQNRASPPYGTPRYTYALTWDVKFRYELAGEKQKTALTFDVYNLLDSRTELYEFTYNEQNRRLPLESTTGRSFRIMLHMQW